MLRKDGVKKNIELTENELVFVTNGSITESTTYGDNNTPAPINKDLGGGWSLWKNIVAKVKSLVDQKSSAIIYQRKAGLFQLPLQH